MYRKRMSDALQEARAYSLISEVMVFKGGRGMSVSKKDLPVFRAKGWKLKEELEEANMKRLLQALQDKLSKEGGAAGFDDLKKTAKTMGVDLTPDMLKNMPGIMQHRDGDYILETIEEGMSISNARKEIQKIYDTAKKAGILGTTGHDNFKELLKQTDRKKLYRDMHKVGSSFGTVGKSNFSTPGVSGSVGDKIGKQLVDLSYKVNEETELEEAFSKKDFQKLEQSNDHTEAAKKLIDMFGTSDEKKEMNDIKARHEKTGYISGKDYSRRIQLTNRYYSRLK